MQCEESEHQTFKVQNLPELESSLSRLFLQRFNRTYLGFRIWSTNSTWVLQLLSFYSWNTSGRHICRFLTTYSYPMEVHHTWFLGHHVWWWKHSVPLSLFFPYVGAQYFVLWSMSTVGFLWFNCVPSPFVFCSILIHLYCLVTPWPNMAFSSGYQHM